MPYRTLATVAVAAGVVAASACGGSSDGAPPGVAAACALIVRYDGHTYRGTAVKVAPVTLEPVGRGELPPCQDVGDRTAVPAEEVELVSIADVPATVAVARRGDTSAILVREDVDFDRLPAALARLLRTPRCDPGDEPIELSGPWQ